MSNRCAALLLLLPMPLLAADSTATPVVPAISSSCHKSDRLGMPPILPALENDGVVTGPPDDLIETVAFGIPGTIMLAFNGKEPDDELSDEELAAVLTYIHNSWSNDDRQLNGEAAGGVVTAADVARVIGGSGGR